jgi:predicted Zn-dependent protease with MMP-like domain
MDPQIYETIVREALSALPAHLRGALKDVLIVIEDEQPPSRPGILLGLYEGVPLPAWGRDFSGKLPDKITLFRASIERVAGSEERIPAIVRETVWHEIGHYFGLDHRQIRKMEERWRGSAKSPPRRQEPASRPLDE